MAFPREGGGGNGGDGEAREERVSSGYYSSSAAARQHGSEQPPPTQQMERRSSVAAAAEEGVGVVLVGSGDPGRIPAAVFERDTSESNKDWSMMSTESVFALQVAPSSDFTGFFLAHPELMDIATPPRSSSSSAAAAAAAGEAVGHAHSAQFESVPELGEATMRIQGQYSFAFPNLVEVKRHSAKNPQEDQPMSATMATAATAETTAPAPVRAETSSKPEEAPAKAATKGGWLPCFPCC
uniref:Uncharacterized protein n=1 Tax=Oryza glumipatula TaxID=40148 RepID=A0A0E0A528_9ORYZ